VFVALDASFLTVGRRRNAVSARRFALSNPRKPRETRELEGNPGHRHIPASPSYPLLTDKVPEDLGDDGRELWVRITTANAKNGVLQETDWPTLLAMCDEWDLYRRAMREVNKGGFLVDTRGKSDASPDKVRSPARIIAQGAFDRFEKLAAKFGLSPVARAGLDTGAESEAMDPVAAARRRTMRAV
jgi:P27 family predicted phage terminase small subunit